MIEERLDIDETADESYTSSVRVLEIVRHSMLYIHSTIPAYFSRTAEENEGQISSKMATVI